MNHRTVYQPPAAQNQQPGKVDCMQVKQQGPEDSWLEASGSRAIHLGQVNQGKQFRAGDLDGRALHLARRPPLPLCC